MSHANRYEGQGYFGELQKSAALPYIKSQFSKSRNCGLQEKSFFPYCLFSFHLPFYKKTSKTSLKLMKCHQSKKNQFQAIYVVSHLIFSLMFYLSVSSFLISQEKKTSRIRAQRLITGYLHQCKAIDSSILCRNEICFIIFGCAHPGSKATWKK